MTIDNNVVHYSDFCSINGNVLILCFVYWAINFQFPQYNDDCTRQHVLPYCEVCIYILNLPSLYIVYRYRDIGCCSVFGIFVFLLSHKKKKNENKQKGRNVRCRLLLCFSSSCGTYRCINVHNLR